MENLSKALNELQEQTIGLFRPFKDTTNWLVVKNDNGSLTCQQIGNLAGLQTMYINQSQGKLLIFSTLDDQYPTLSKLKELPFRLDMLVKQFNK